MHKHWEHLFKNMKETRPLPEIDPELEDVDKIGLYIVLFIVDMRVKCLD